jgi:hypothetical protein
MNANIPGAYIGVKQTLIDKRPLPPRISGNVTACLRKEISLADLVGDHGELLKKSNKSSKLNPKPGLQFQIFRTIIEFPSPYPLIDINFSNW